MSRLLLQMLLLPLLASVLGASCGGKNAVGPRTYDAPSIAEVLEHLATHARHRRSFRAESVMDYWLEDERIKSKVLLMGRTGARVRINALNPTGDNVAADLACDGISFKYIDYNNNCHLVGPCTRDSIAELLRIRLDPDDFLLMVVGTTPVIANAQGTVEWDSKQGREIVELVAADGTQTQTIILDGRERRWDVLKSTVRDARGNVLWELVNKEFRSIQSVDGASIRVPGRTRLVQPAEEADLIVRWEERTLNLELDSGKFDMTVPPGLRSCRTMSLGTPK